MNKEPEARIWATSTDLANTNQERKRYFLVIEDNGKRRDVELVFGPGAALSVEPFVPHEMDYTVHDSCDHRAEVNYCVLEDPESFEFADMMENQQYYLDRDKHPPKEEQSTSYLKAQFVPPGVRDHGELLRREEEEQ